MKYYIDRATCEVFAYESDGSQDSFISHDLELLDDKGLAEVRAAQEAAAAPTPEQVLQSANAQRDSLLAVAGLRIAPLQDAVDQIVGRHKIGDELCARLDQAQRIRAPIDKFAERVRPLLAQHVVRVPRFHAALRIDAAGAS